MSKFVSLVVALGPNGVIGDKTSLLWHSKKDFEFFKFVTMGKPCIFGYNTFFNLPAYPLKNRLNIVASLDYTKDSVVSTGNGSYIEVPSVEEGLILSSNYDDVVICGGRSIYEYVLKNKLVNRIYFSEINSLELRKKIETLNEADLAYFPVDLKEYCKDWNKVGIDGFNDKYKEFDLNLSFNCYVRNNS